MTDPTLLIGLVIAVLGWFITLLMFGLTSVNANRAWLRDRRDEAYKTTMRILEEGNLLYLDNWQIDRAVGELATVLPLLRMYATKRTYMVAKSLVGNLKYSSLDPGDDEELAIEVDRAVKGISIDAMELDLSIQAETRSRLARLTRRPLDREELRARIRQLRDLRPEPTRYAKKDGTQALP